MRAWEKWRQAPRNFDTNDRIESGAFYDYLLYFDGWSKLLDEAVGDGDMCRAISAFQAAYN